MARRPKSRRLRSIASIRLTPMWNSAVRAFPAYRFSTLRPQVPTASRAPLDRSGAETGIAVAELSPRSVYTPDYEKLRRRTGHHGLVIVCEGAQPGLGLLNAERFRHPYGAPAIHVSSEASAAVFAASARRASARLVAASCRTPAQACNVVVRIDGQDRARAPVVIMTPRSSWWQSTAERGGGLVCWLESLRALVASPPLCDVIFTANSGHELGHLGLDDFMTRHPGWERPCRRRRCVLGPLWSQYRRARGRALDPIDE